MSAKQYPRIEVEIRDENATSAIVRLEGDGILSPLCSWRFDREDAVRLARAWSKALGIPMGRKP